MNLTGFAYPEFAAWLKAQVGCSDRFHRAAYRSLFRSGRWDPATVPEWQRVGSDAQGLITLLKSLAEYEQAPPVVTRQCAQDPAYGDTEKLLLRLGDGREVEAVSIPMAHDGHRTVCVSSQVGCRMGCTFCRTARMGFVRQLSAAEIVGQVLAVVRETGIVPRNLVFMGMGEPLDNLDAVAQAVRVVTERCGLGMAGGHVTISTVGRVAGLARFAELGLDHANLAVSLHAADDALRSELVPVARTEPLAQLKAALLALPLRRGRRIMISAVVIPGVTDTPQLIQALAAWCQDLPVLVNLIPFNPFPGVDWRAPEATEVRAMRDALDRLGVPVRQRVTKGAGVLAACGQLATGRTR